MVMTRLWQVSPYYSILLIPDIEPIILSKVAHYSQLGTHCVQYYVVCMQYKNDVNFLI